VRRLRLTTQSDLGQLPGVVVRVDLPESHSDPGTASPSMRVDVVVHTDPAS
jgi:hypothetical protein